MSFAGPSDPALHDALVKANKKGMVLIAAAGNAGPDPNVIAVTATDSRDALFPGANRGNYIAVAAPGVDVFAPAPEGTYQLTTGTSVAAAEVSGVAALLIERNPALTPAGVRKILVDTAFHLGPKGRSRFDLGCAHHVPVRQRAEIELDARPVAPVEWNFVDGGGGLAVIHGRGKVPGRVEMGAVVGRQVDPPDRPALALRQVLAREPRKVSLQQRDHVPMGVISNGRSASRRVRLHVIFEWNREIDDARAHDDPSAGVSVMSALLMCHKRAPGLPRTCSACGDGWARAGMARHGAFAARGRIGTS
jgi:hypothetical protein